MTMIIEKKRNTLSLLLPFILLSSNVIAFQTIPKHTSTTKPGTTVLYASDDDKIPHDGISRRNIVKNAASVIATATALSISIPTIATAAEDSMATTPALVATAVEQSSSNAVAGGIPIGASWSAVEGLNSSGGGSENDKNKNGNFVSFDMSAYKAMKEDPTRTPLFKKVIASRLAALKGQGIALDLGTGPYALFAILAAEAGAKRVYAIEADPAVAASARQVIAKSGWADVITVYNDFSSRVTLPEKVDLCIAELCGSICSEEGVLATIVDAHNRFMKNPTSSDSWIPERVQTYAAPASYALHNLFGPPEFDWGKLKGEPVRFNCRDDSLQLLADPVLIEDINFADILKETTTKDDVGNLAWIQNSIIKSNVVYTIDPKRIEDNVNPIIGELRRGSRNSPEESEKLARETAASFSGIAMWPRLFLDCSMTNEEVVVINSRGYPKGAHQRSHWQTVLPIMADRPIGPLKGGETISVDFDFTIPITRITQPAKYSITGTVNGVVDPKNTNV